MCILSILIPTYNRVTYLRKAVENLTEQIKNQGFENKVELCISDNGSIDGTERYLSDLQDSFICINRHSFNCGYDVNICTLLNISKGEYVWFLSDDDVISKDGLAWIVEQLSNDLHGLYLKPIFFRENPVKLRGKPAVIEYPDHIQALKDINWVVSFVSAFVMKKSDIQSSKFQKFIGLGFIHTPMILDLLSKGKWKALGQGVLYVRQGNSGGYNKYEYFGTNFNRILRSFEQQYGRETIKYVLEIWMDIVVVPCISEDRLKNAFRLKNIKPLFCYKNMSFFWRHVVPHFFI